MSNVTEQPVTENTVNHSVSGRSTGKISNRYKIREVVLYECETWSLTLREERRPRVFENRVVRRIFGPKKDEVTGKWRRLHNEELYDLYSSQNIIRVIKSRRMRLAGHVVCIGEKRGVYRVLVGKPEGKRLFGRPRRRWEDNIKMDIQEVEWWGHGLDLCVSG
jgi:hypothetical protein